MLPFILKALDKAAENNLNIPLLVRHLVLPDNLAGTRDVMTFLTQQVSPGTRVNIMSQYRPMGQAKKVPGLSRAVTAEEVHKARKIAKDLGLVLLR